MDASSPSSPWMVVTEAASYARVSTKTLYRAVSEAKLRAARVGNRRALRFKAEYLDQWLDATTTPVESSNSELTQKYDGGRQ